MIEIRPPERHGEEITLRIEGEFAGRMWSTEVGRALDGALLDDGLSLVRLDLTGVSFLDNYGVGTILALYRECQEARKRLALRVSVGQCREKLRITGLIGLLEEAGHPVRERPGRPAPLVGVRVLDLTRLLPGGYCTLLLADLGADVIKVEEPGRGDYIRWTPPMLDGVSAAHRSLNRGKRSMTLNLKDAEGADLFRRLATRADVVVESFRPGVMDRLGLDHERLSKANRALVYCSITGYGQDGPYRDRAGHDINYIGYGGILAMGPNGAEPALPGVQIGDLGGGGMLAAIGILAALVERRATGMGRFVDVSMLDGVISWLSIHAGAFLALGPGGGGGPLSGALACYRLYRTGDGRHVTVGALEPQFWRGLCEALGVPELVEEQFAPPDRQREMADRLQRIFLTRSRDEWLEALVDVETCVGPVNDIGEALQDAQVVHRGMVAAVEGTAVGPGPPLKLSELRPAPFRPAPGFGEHTAEVLAAIGIDEERLDDLRNRGVV